MIHMLSQWELRHNVQCHLGQSESFVYYLLCALAMFDVSRFPNFVGASDVISSVLSICLLYKLSQSKLHGTTEVFKQSYGFK